MNIWKRTTLLNVLSSNFNNLYDFELQGHRYLQNDKVVVYNKKSDNDIYVWEYRFTKLGDNFDEYSIKVDLIYHANKKDLTLNQIVENFSKFFDREKKTVPVFEFKCEKC
jgi:hypothetical protein